uniref:Histidine kinase n=1 Tax=Echinostoma caproni TaxID=27848 RepID=A0A183BE46_9TREM
LATFSAAGAVLVSYLQSRLLVDACLNADLTRLRRQYPIDWDPAKRHLHLLTGRANILATLSVSTSGAFRLVGLQHKATDDVIDPEDVADAFHYRLEDFTAPLSRSLDEWILEVNDFCTGITETG